jgi:hypothetical protein
MKTCLFAGPTLYQQSIAPPIECFGPAAMGSLFRAVEAGFRRVGIVDGYFGNKPSIWHKEILFALDQGVEVVGAASMGALRAAEMSVYGMTGIGRIYRLYRNGRMTDDDEVAVIHAPRYLGFQPLSHAMVNIRYTLRRLVRQGVIDAALSATIAHRMKLRHFSQRTAGELHQSLTVIAATTDVNPDRIMQQFIAEYVDAKRLDAVALVDYLANSAPLPRQRRAWRFPATAHWRRQFEQDLADVPPLS